MSQPDAHATLLLSPAHAALLDLVGVLLRADADNALSQVLHTEGIQDAFNQALAQARAELEAKDLIAELESRYNVTLKAQEGTPAVMPKRYITVDQLRAEAENTIAYLRTVIDDPTEIRIGRHTSLEVRPVNEGDEVIVFRKDWGGTKVNYTEEGVILDVFSADESRLESIYTAAIPRDDLEDPERVAKEEAVPASPSP